MVGSLSLSLSLTHTHAHTHAHTHTLLTPYRNIFHSLMVIIPHPRSRCNDFAPEDVEPACRLSLQNLQLDYLDLYLVHQVAGLKKDAPSDLSAVTDEHRLGYSPENMAKTWEVCGCDS